MKQVFIPFAVLLWCLSCGNTIETPTDAESDIGFDAGPDAEEEEDAAIVVDEDVVKVPPARVMVQLTWKEGLKTRADLDKPEGVAVDLDLHLIKRKGMDACGNEVDADGRMCTVMASPGAIVLDTRTHDDCHWQDMGENGLYVCNGCENECMTIAWHAAFVIDNRWGGDNYLDPEVIILGPIADEEPKDGFPDVTPFNDEYMIVVNYNNCQDLTEPWDGPQERCQEGSAYYNVHAKVEIFVDDALAPRAGTQDDKSLSRTEFVIRPDEWIVIGTFTWDRPLVSAISGWPGDAIVRDVPVSHEKVCRFNPNRCYDLPIWDVTAYEEWVTAPDVPQDFFASGDGECYDYGERE
ncbi:MAG TPA: hypothetical protein P5077_02435 [bacterium]|nr:hypothetical protein [bacterium]